MTSELNKAPPRLPPAPWHWSRADFCGAWREQKFSVGPEEAFEALVVADGTVVGIAQDASSYRAEFDADPSIKAILAAAPELLEALENLRTAHEVYDHSNMYGDVNAQLEAQTQIKAALANADSAIAKARGRV
jgi:hypothetical protein